MKNSETSFDEMVEAVSRSQYTCIHTLQVYYFLIIGPTPRKIFLD